MQLLTPPPPHPPTPTPLFSHYLCPSFVCMSPPDLDHSYDVVMSLQVKYLPITGALHPVYLKASKSNHNTDVQTLI